MPPERRDTPEWIRHDREQRNEWRNEFNHLSRRAIIDIAQAANYLDSGHYDKAFDNVESAAKTLLLNLTQIKGKIIYDNRYVKRSRALKKRALTTKNRE